jgi:transcriptional regulator
LTGKVVPTWNYITVQAHGTISTIHDPEWLIPHVGRLVARHEAGRPDPWSITDAPVDGTIDGLSAGTPLEQAVAEAMRRRR